MPKHFVWLDSLRGLAAILVVIFHYHHFFLRDSEDRSNLPASIEFPYADYLNWVYQNGNFAVQLFWVISGFVFYHVYMQRRPSTIEFVSQRFARLYPLHILTLLIVVFIQIVSSHELGYWQIYGNNDSKHFVLQVLLSSNWNTLNHGLSYNGPIWSVSLEVIVYFVFLVALSMLQRFPLIATALLLNLSWIIQALTQQQNLWVIQSGVFYCASHFFSGGLIYLVFQHSVERSKSLIIPSLLLLVSTGAWAVYDSQSALILSICLVLVFLFVVADRMVSTSLKSLKHLGDISYSLYLVHVPIQMLVLLTADMFFAADRSFASHPGTLPVYLAVTVAVASVTYTHFEAPSGRYLRKKLRRFY